MPDLPRRIRLAAGDYFMYGQDRHMRASGLPGNVCRVALRLDGGFNAELLRERVAASPMLNWLSRLRIVRFIPAVPPVWRAEPLPRPLLHEHRNGEVEGDGLGQVPQTLIGRDLNSDRGPALALDLAKDRNGSSHLVLSWNHALMDVRGAELVLRHLNAGESIEDCPTLEDLINPDQKRSGLMRLWRTLTHAHGSMKWLRESGREPLFTLLSSGPLRRPCRGRNRLIPFSRQETARIGERCQQLNAAFRRSHFYLAASLRALHAIAVSRGNKDGAYLVPVPHDMRRRGSTGPIFSNHLSILFYRIEPPQAVRLSSIIDELTRQMMEQIRTRFPESCMAALDMFKPLPLDYYVRHLGQPTRGKFASLCFSDSGESCAGMTEYLGGRIQAVTHLVPTWRPPGLTVLFWSFGGQLCALLSWVEDCLAPAEAETLERGLRFALLEEELA
jgi:hypothetical protein